MMSVIMLIGLGLNSIAQETKNGPQVYTIGAMKVVKGGDLESTTEIKTEQGIEHMYGLGPLDSLTGEVMILDGVIYISKLENGQEVVTTVDQIKAPFFVLSEVPNWKSSILNADIQTLEGIEAYLLMAYHILQKPFAFQVVGTFDEVAYHIQNRTAQTEVEQPFEIHKHQAKYTLKNVAGTLLGFYSPNHEGVFTHKGQKIHVHFLSEDKNHMGHVDHLMIGDKGVNLLLPLQQ